MDTLRKLAVKQQFDTALLHQVVAPAKCHDLVEYLKSFDITLQLMQTYEQLEESAYATAKAAALENVRYMELRFAPSLHTEADMTVSEVIAAVSEGVRLAVEQY